MSTTASLTARRYQTAFQILFVGLALAFLASLYVFIGDSALPSSRRVVAASPDNPTQLTSPAGEALSALWAEAA